MQRQPQPPSSSLSQDDPTPGQSQPSSPLPQQGDLMQGQPQFPSPPLQLDNPMQGQSHPSSPLPQLDNTMEEQPHSPSFSQQLDNLEPGQPQLPHALPQLNNLDLYPVRYTTIPFYDDDIVPRRNDIEVSAHGNFLYTVESG